MKFTNSIYPHSSFKVISDTKTDDSSIFVSLESR